MIVFEKISWKNFLSTGNAANVVQLDATSTTLIIGKNGHGKSTILDALCFVLYGKAFRNISKHQMTNSKNGKNAEVIVWFKTQGKTYKVVRTIKPNNFEIYVDGVLITQDAAIKDYQKVLEQQILKMNYKTFTQVVILGSASFTPFMQLSAGNRREVIDDILDIKIISIMNTVLKAQITETKDEISRIDSDLVLLKSQVSSQKKLIQTLQNAQQDKTDKIKQQINQLEHDRSGLLQQLFVVENELVNEQTDLVGYTADPKAVDANRESIMSLEHEIQLINGNLGFFKDHDECSMCSQNIEHAHKNYMIMGLEARLQECEAQLINSNAARQTYRSLQTMVDKSNEKIRLLKQDIASRNGQISRVDMQITSLKSELVASKNPQTNIDAEKAKLKDIAAKAMKSMERKSALTEQRSLQDISSIMLKDTGIKSKIIKEYLPLMNKLINKYLQAQDSYVQFEMDEQFNETIKSRYRDEFTYASFSEGEKQRIDLAILFTWREVAKLKNSANTNLLFLDEILNGSLDEDGKDTAQQLIETLAADGTNVFVVSHEPDKLQESFVRTLVFEKKHDYSLVHQL